MSLFGVYRLPAAGHHTIDRSCTFGRCWSLSCVAGSWCRCRWFTWWRGAQCGRTGMVPLASNKPSWDAKHPSSSELIHFVSMKGFDCLYFVDGLVGKLTWIVFVFVILFSLLLMRDQGERGRETKIPDGSIFPTSSTSWIMCKGSAERMRGIFYTPTVWPCLVVVLHSL